VNREQPKLIDIPGIIVIGVWDWCGEAERGNVGHNEDKEGEGEGGDGI
jgi:hypothetical protein